MTTYPGRDLLAPRGSPPESRRRRRAFRPRCGAASAGSATEAARERSSPAGCRRPTRSGSAGRPAEKVPSGLERAEERPRSSSYAEGRGDPGEDQRAGSAGAGALLSRSRPQIVPSGERSRSRDGAEPRALLVAVHGGGVICSSGESIFASGRVRKRSTRSRFAVERRNHRRPRRARRRVPAGEGRRCRARRSRARARDGSRPRLRRGRSCRCRTVSWDRRTRLGLPRQRAKITERCQRTHRTTRFHEIQLNGKQLVFLFMAATVVSVVIFLCGVLVGRGVRAERALAAADATTLGSVPVPTVESNPPVATATTAASDPTKRRHRNQPKTRATSPGSKRRRRPPRSSNRKPRRSSRSVEPRHAAPPGSAAASSASRSEPAPPARPAHTAACRGRTNRIRASDAAARSGCGGIIRRAGGFRLCAAGRGAQERGEAESIAKRLASKGYAVYVLSPTNGTPACVPRSRRQVQDAPRSRNGGREAAKGRAVQSLDHALRAPVDLTSVPCSCFPRESK